MSTSGSTAPTLSIREKEWHGYNAACWYMYTCSYHNLIRFLSLSLLPIGSGVEGAWCGSRAAGGDGRRGVLPGARARVFQQPGLQRAGAAPHVCHGPHQVWCVAPVHGKCCTPVV